jgi:catechol 2,3-dioxygenase-like lactoylglutathione lyase family enzyme
VAAVTGFASVAPVLPVRDLEAAVTTYEQLGFTVERYAGDAPYAFARRDDVWLHLSEVGDLDPLTSMVSVYLYVADADALHDEWRAAGVGGRLHPPQDTDYGLREGAYVDPDGTLLRFGSWLTSPPRDARGH